jgi:hypothetical protein
MLKTIFFLILFSATPAFAAYLQCDLNHGASVERFDILNWDINGEFYHSTADMTGHSWMLGFTAGGDGSISLKIQRDTHIEYESVPLGQDYKFNYPGETETHTINCTVY